MADQGNLGDWTDCMLKPETGYPPGCGAMSTRPPGQPPFLEHPTLPVTPTGRLSPAPTSFPTKPPLPKLLHPQLSRITIPSDQDPSGWTNTWKCHLQEQSKPLFPRVSCFIIRGKARERLFDPQGPGERGEPWRCTCWFICWQAGLTTDPSLWRASELSAHIL